jgi:hypothetical protein
MRHDPPQLALRLPLHGVEQSAIGLGCEPLFTALPAKHWTPSSTPQNGSPRAAHIDAQTSAVMSSWCGSIGATVMPTGSVRASRASE